MNGDIDQEAQEPQQEIPPLPKGYVPIKKNGQKLPPLPAGYTPVSEKKSKVGVSPLPSSDGFLPGQLTRGFRTTDVPIGGEKKPPSNLPIGKAALLGLASTASGTLKSIGIAAKQLDFFKEYTDKKAEDLATYKAGQWIDDQVKDLVGELSPEEQDKFAVKLAQGVGQMGGFLLGGVGGKVLKMSPLLTTAGLGAAVQGSSEYENAIASGATPEQAAKVFWINGAIGTTEALPIMGAFRKLDKYSGGLATGALARKIASTAGGRLTSDIAQGFMQEAAQEAGQQILTNVVAKNTYDVTRNIWEGVGESAAIGGIIGFAMNGAASAIREKRMMGGLTKEEDIQLAAAQEFAERKANEALDQTKTEITTTNENPKVKSILKAKTDVEADLASNESLPADIRSAMQSQIEKLNQEIDQAKSEVYQDELDEGRANILAKEIESNSDILKDETLSKETKDLIKTNIDESKTELKRLKKEKGISPQKPIVEEEITQPEIKPEPTKVTEQKLPRTTDDIYRMLYQTELTTEQNNRPVTDKINNDTLSLAKYKGRVRKRYELLQQLKDCLTKNVA